MSDQSKPGAGGNPTIQWTRSEMRRWTVDQLRAQIAKAENHPMATSVIVSGLPALLVDMEAVLEEKAAQWNDSGRLLPELPRGWRVHRIFETETWGPEGVTRRFTAILYQSGLRPGAGWRDSKSGLGRDIPEAVRNAAAQITEG